MTDRDAHRAQVRVAATNEIEAATTLAELETARIRALGKKGTITLLYDDLGSLPLDQRKQEGAANNAIKFQVIEKRTRTEAELKANELPAQLAAETLDVTLPAR